LLSLDRFNGGVALLADLHLISDSAATARHVVFIHGVRFGGTGMVKDGLRDGHQLRLCAYRLNDAARA
jgi:hypothetical protein